jgi:hypothetical protein
MSLPRVRKWMTSAKMLRNYVSSGRSYEFCCEIGDVQYSQYCIEYIGIFRIALNKYELFDKRVRLSVDSSISCRKALACKAAVFPLEFWLICRLGRP